MPGKANAKPGAMRWLLVVLAAAIALLVIAPGAVSAGLGRVIADLWITTMSAVMSIFGGLFGGA